MGRLLLALLTLTRLASVRERDVKVDNETERTVRMVECNNLTLIYLILRVTGPAPPTARWCPSGAGTRAR